MTEEELMALSRKYHENKKAIVALVMKQLEARKPQVLIARDFGMEKSNIAHRARRNGISYYDVGEK